MTMPAAAIAGVVTNGGTIHAAVDIQVNWQQPTGMTATSLSYGLNVFQAFDPKIAGKQGMLLFRRMTRRR